MEEIHCAIAQLAEQVVVTDKVPGSKPGGAAKKYSEVLGMPVSTAMARLKKTLFFELIQQTGRDECLKCGKLIEHSEELSVDHKEPWRLVSAELFWDLDNVGFSHVRCNTADRHPLKKIGPEGTSWCAHCRQFLPTAEFGTGARNGLHCYCKSCDRERVANYAQRNPRFPCPNCRYQMRKKCHRCGHELSMAEYMALRRREGVRY